MQKKTDWNAYYHYRNISPITRITRYISSQCLIKEINKYVFIDSIKVLELGGANSCFYQKITNSFHGCFYTILDNNKLGLDMFNETYKKKNNYNLINANILNLNKKRLSKHDLVFSVGLIEHFKPNEIKKIIKLHFDLTRENGIVIITFPTPTLLYQLTRKFLEFTNNWIFFDEIPLKMHSIKNEICKNGIVLNEFVNWKIPLTQGFIIAKKISK